MKCEDCLIHLEGYAEGELGGQHGTEISEHVGACAACAAYYGNLLREQDIYERYFLEAEPTPALWKNLQAEIKEGKVIRAPAHTTPSKRALAETLRGISLTFTGRAALACLVSVVACAVIVLLVRTKPPTAGRAEISRASSAGPDAHKQPDSPPASDLAAKESGPQISRAALTPHVRVTPLRAGFNGRQPRAAGKSTQKNSPAPLRATVPPDASLPGEQSYVRAIAELTSELEPSVAKMPTDLRAEYQRNLEIVDRVIAEARLAARRHPGNPDAAGFVMSAYRGKLTLLTSVGNLSMLPPGGSN